MCILSKRKETKSMKKKVEINPDILYSSKLKLDEIDKQFVELEDTFRDDFYKIFTTKDDSTEKITINDSNELISLLELNKALKTLRKCQGYEKHIKTYEDEDAFRHNQSITFFATFLLSKVDNLEFEPTVQHFDNKSGKESSKVPDIKISKDGIDIYIEHESFNTKKFIYKNDHTNFAKLVIKNLKDTIYLLQIIHKRPFSPKYKTEEYRAKKLCKEISDKLSSARNEETIIDGDEYNVHIEKSGFKSQTTNVTYIEHARRDKFNSQINENETICVKIKKDDIKDKELYKYCIYLLLHDIDEDYIYPAHIFFDLKNTIMIAGPKDINFKTILEDKLKKAGSQSPDGKPYVLAINEGEILGDSKENRKILDGFFQSGKNTRFSGILLIKKCNNKEIDFNFIQNRDNPYCQQVSDIFKKLKGQN